MIDFSYNIDLLKKVVEYSQNKFNAFVYDSYFEIVPEYEKLLNARYHKNYRIKQRLIFLLTRYKYIWFVTFTFSDKYINKSVRTKRDLVKSALNNEDFKYILNVDYGESNMREHYHCIVATNCDIDLHEYFSKKYVGGFSKSIICKTSISDVKRLTQYINKLVNHCIKATTNKQRLVYNFKGYDDIYTHTSDKRLAYLLDYYSIINRDVSSCWSTNS